MELFGQTMGEILSRKLMNQAGADGADGGGNGADNSDNGQGSASDGGNNNADMGGDNGGFGGTEINNNALSEEALLSYKQKYASENGEIDFNRAFADLHNFESNNKAPEEYGYDFLKDNESFKDYDIQADKDPLITAAAQWGKENGVPQGKMESLITLAMENVKAIHLEQQQEYQNQIQEGWKNIQDGEARKTKLNAMLSGTLGDEVSKVLSQIAEDPRAFVALEQMANKMRDPVINDNNYQPTRLTEADASKLRSERDKALDAGNYAEVERLEKQISGIYKGLAEAGLLN